MCGAGSAGGGGGFEGGGLVGGTVPLGSGVPAVGCLAARAAGGSTGETLPSGKKPLLFLLLMLSWCCWAVLAGVGSRGEIDWSARPMLREGSRGLAGALRLSREAFEDG
jgi:hypothetical protein